MVSLDEDDMDTQANPNERLKEANATATDVKDEESKPKHVSAKLWEVCTLRLVVELKRMPCNPHYERIQF